MRVVLTPSKTLQVPWEISARRRKDTISDFDVGCFSCHSCQSTSFCNKCHFNLGVCLADVCTTYSHVFPNTLLTRRCTTLYVARLVSADHELLMLPKDVRDHDGSLGKNQTRLEAPHRRPNHLHISLEKKTITNPNHYHCPPPLSPSHDPPTSPHCPPRN